MKRISPHLIRAPKEPLNADIQKFYYNLLSVIKQPVLRDGTWQLLDCIPAWQGNGSWDAFIAFGWMTKEGKRIVMVVNYAQHQSQCYLKLPFTDLIETQWQFQDLMSEACYDRNGNDLQTNGLYLDMPAWHYHVFEVKKSKRRANEV